MPRKEWLIGLMVFVILGAVSFVWLAPPPGEPAPAIEFEMLNGQSVELASLKGEPVLIQFWATDCTTCVSEMPDLMELHHALHADGLNLVGVAMAYDPEDRVRRLVARKGLPYAIALDNGGVIADAFGNVRVTPTTVLIDAAGRVVWQRIGLLDFDRLHEEITELLPEERSA